MSICDAEVPHRLRILEAERLDRIAKGFPWYPQHPRHFQYFPAGGNGGGTPQSAKGLLSLPNELIDEIASYLMVDRVDMYNFRLVNKQVGEGAAHAFKHLLVQDRILYPRYECLAHFAFLCSAFLGVNRMVRSITLVAEGLKAHEYGSGWAWEHFVQWEDVVCTDKDLEIMLDIDASHAAELRITNQFIHRGGYRQLLGQILKDCPNLKVVNVRKLEAGEQIPGWDGATMFKDLSFYRPGLNTNFIHYGDWQYDTDYHRETVHKDEFGDNYTESFAGPQAGFADDMLAAVKSTGRKIKVNFK